MSTVKLSSLSKKKLCVLSIIYTMAHGFLLIASGRWWDDWAFYDVPKETVWTLSSQTGRPSMYYIMRFVELMPVPVYRILTFVMFWFCMMFLYHILKNWLALRDDSCFWICAIYSIVPANDTRIINGAFPYTFGLFFFMAGLYYLSVLLQKDKIHILCRTGNYVLFLLSFVLNSNLCFYSIALLMILMRKKSIVKMLGFLDYILLPVLFYVLKCRLFPVWGEYENYNIVSVEKMIGSLAYLPIANLHVLRDLLTNFWNVEIWMKLSIIALLVIASLVINNGFIRKHIDSAYIYSIGEPETTKKLGGVVLLGIIVLSAGIFPYIVVRYSYEAHDIRTTGLNGRDAILVAFGVALILYGLICLLVNVKVRVYCFLLMIVCGIVFFNSWYLSYQQNWYEQTGFRYQLGQHDELKSAVNILCLTNPIGNIYIKNFHQLNGNAEIVYGDTNRFIMGDKDWCTSIKDDGIMEKLKNNPIYHMSGYDLNHKTLDAIVYYGMDINLQEVMKMKLYELIGSSRFDDWVRERSWMKVYLNGSSEFDELVVSEEIATQEQ